MAGSFAVRHTRAPEPASAGQGELAWPRCTKRPRRRPPSCSRTGARRVVRPRRARAVCSSVPGTVVTRARASCALRARDRNSARRDRDAGSATRVAGFTTRPPRFAESADTGAGPSTNCSATRPAMVREIVLRGFRRPARSWSRSLVGRPARRTDGRVAVFRGFVGPKPVLVEGLFSRTIADFARSGRDERAGATVSTKRNRTPARLEHRPTWAGDPTDLGHVIIASPGDRRKGRPVARGPTLESTTGVCDPPRAPAARPTDSGTGPIPRRARPGNRAGQGSSVQVWPEPCRAPVSVSSRRVQRNFFRQKNRRRSSALTRSDEPVAAAAERPQPEPEKTHQAIAYPQRRRRDGHRAAGRSQCRSWSRGHAHTPTRAGSRRTGLAERE